jgi:hypothetical protein
MADISASSSSKDILPQLMQTDDEPAAAEPARRKANTKKPSLFPFLSRTGKRSVKNLKRASTTEDASNDIPSSSSSLTRSYDAPPTNPLVTDVDEWPLVASADTDVPAVPEPNTQIELDCSSAPREDDFKDVYRWAVVYENQRG